MPIIDQKTWNECVEKNTDPYGKCCVDVAREVMRQLDVVGVFNASDLISKADNDIKAGGITGFMAGCIAQIVSKCHSRGDEFRRSWNAPHCSSPEELNKIDDKGGVINPAILTISNKNA